MAIRRWAVRPDRILELSNDESIAACSREAMREAFLDGEALMAQSGGIFSVVSFRARTDLDGEMVTVSAVCEWKDRADARAQPEPAAQSAPVPPDDVEAQAAVAELVGAGEGQAVEGDELEEDLSSIPEHARSAVA